MNRPVAERAELELPPDGYGAMNIIVAIAFTVVLLILIKALADGRALAAHHFMYLCQQIKEGNMTVNEALKSLKDQQAAEHASLTAYIGRVNKTLGELRDQLAAAGNLTPEQEADVAGIIADGQAEIDEAGAQLPLDAPAGPGE